MNSEITAAARAAIVAANGRKPLKTDWGFCCVDEGPGYAGGGVKSYYWFKNKAELVAFLKNHAADLAIAGDDDDIDRAALAQQIAEDFPPGADDLDFDDVMATLDDILDRYISFEWIGAFEDLTSGSSDYATDLRETFREERNESDRVVDGIAPLKKHEMADFRRFLTEV